MSDNFSRFRSILKSIKKLYPSEPKGNLARHLFTLAALISGIIGSKSSQLPTIAAKVADSRKPESRVKTFTRWIQNSKIDYETYFMPYAELLLTCLCQQTLVIVFDSSLVGRNCLTLMACVVYKNRALPLCWITQPGTTGHFAEAIHLELVEQLKQLIPENATVVFLGDGEFDGSELVKTITGYNWYFVCRTSKNRILYENGEAFHFQDVSVDRDDYFRIPNVRFADLELTFDAVVWWNKQYKEPIYLITNIELAQEVMYWYKKRFRIETMFSDKKSRGFNIHKSHISEPERINKLLIATSLAYIFIIYFGILAIKEGFNKIIHRTDRCDLSLSQLGFRLLDYLLNNGQRIPDNIQLKLFNEL